MAAFHGKGGSATFTNLVFEILSYTVDAICDMTDVTDMSDAAAGWKAHLASFKDWSASCECNLPITGAVATLATQLGSTATLSFAQSAGPDYGGTAYCTGIGPAGDVNDVGKITFTFQGSGALAET